MEIVLENYKIHLLDTSQPKAFYQLIANNRTRLEDFFAGTVVFTQTLVDTEKYCEVINERIENRAYFPYIISKEGEYIGLIDVKNIDWNIPKAEIGYFIDKHYEGKGIISKAFGLVVDYIIQTYGFKKLLCRVAAENVGSAKVAIKNGFLLEGTIRRDYKTTSGALVDLCYYGKLF